MGCQCFHLLWELWCLWFIQWEGSLWILIGYMMCGSTSFCHQMHTLRLLPFMNVTCFWNSDVFKYAYIENELQFLCICRTRHGFGLGGFWLWLILFISPSISLDSWFQGSFQGLSRGISKRGKRFMLRLLRTNHMYQRGRQQTYVFNFAHFVMLCVWYISIKIM